jgi:hypothetical protein
MGSLPPGHLLTAEQIAASIVWTLIAPPGVDVNTMSSGRWGNRPDPAGHTP